MFRMLVDTCVWLDVARDRKQIALLGVVEQMIRRRLLSLIVPRLLLDEFRRNRARIEKDSAKSLASQLKIVKDAVKRAGGNKRKTRGVLSYLDDVGHKIPILGGAAVGALDRIETMLTASAIVETSDGVKVCAAERAIGSKAPFHRNKNAMGDAILVETYAACVNDKNTSRIRFAFVTHNTADFSVEHGDQSTPHPDLAALFSRVKSLYFISLPQALRRVEPSLVTEVMFEESWSQEPRGLSEILEAEELLFNQVWYNRHWNSRIGIRDGTIKLVEKDTYPRARGAPETIQRDVWAQALKAARRVEQLYGKTHLGPWDDFEWGMINGKLSALRWVLGDEWDMLDT